ncbi:cyclic nucleotide-binding protein [Bacillus sp. S3]|uniref:dimethyl sulfoxide reductase anchor subunit family protein n=1 Tax=Bacillus sp. S3 TaxID=486398 RepID=UPI00118C8728|nr:DmsC/YnfH family molybdoenzyme membrane anchor subunit [Bacillus sp. S3]QCJ40922.1 cyclic nucleotide-binding protein [Bacillus sp. S3]
MHEWALLIFTIAIPAAVGGILFLWFINGQMADGGANSIKVMKVPLLVIASLAIVGLFGAFFHLGKPIHALNAIRGFGRSWMSNEIVVTGVFIALACVTAGLAVVQKKINPVLMLITGLVGMIDIYCMASAYTVTRVNGWNHLNTYFVFYGTAFSLGPILGASLLAKSLKGEAILKAIKWAFTFSIIGIAVQLIGSAMFNAYIPEIQTIAGETAAHKMVPYSGMIGVRWVIEIAGLVLLAYLSLKNKLNYAFIYAALIFFVIAEGMSRYVFYVLGS